MLVRDVVTDVVAVFEHPEFCFSSGLRDHLFGCTGRNNSIQASHDHQQRTLHLLHYALEIKGLQHSTRSRLVGNLEAIDKGLARQKGTLLKVGGEVIGPGVANSRLATSLEGCSTRPK